MTLHLFIVSALFIRDAKLRVGGLSLITPIQGLERAKSSFKFSQFSQFYTVDRLLLEKTVLVLNQNYEPLSTCSVRRALLLILRGKAEAVEKMSEVVHSVSQDFPVPSVVRLERYIRAPRRRVVLSKRNIL